MEPFLTVWEKLIDIMTLLKNIKVHKCLLNLKRLSALWTLQNITDTREYEIAICIQVGWVCGYNFVLVMVQDMIHD